MGIPTLEAAIRRVHEASVRLYLQRQTLQAQANDVQQRIVECERELWLLDGELRALTALQGQLDA